ncbi:UNVERIFIED_CONTAM: hypothetical protein B566_EDAN017736 [Ephemera danica]|nr:hypothetical protein B566_EDAN017736 [Ephemera danica]
MWLLRPTLLVLVLVTVACSARYEDGYRGGNKRSRYASESEEDDSDEKHEHVAQGYDERRYKYESSESDEKSSEEDHHGGNFVHFKKRRLQHYANHIEGEDDGFFDDVKYNRVPGSHLEHRDRERDYKQEKENQDRRGPERYQEAPRQYSDQYQARQYYPERQMGAQEVVYSWKQDREIFPPLPPLVIPPPEKPHKDFVPSSAGRADPPPPTEAARMARYIVHNTDWATMATISTMPKIKGYPFSNTVSISDGPIDASSGVPYLYLTPLEMSTHDLSLKNGTQAAKKAEEALFPRHPIMRTWPKDHGFFFATLKIDQIVLLDYFGGPKYISVKDYFQANPGS